MKPNEIVEIDGQRFHSADSKGRPYVRITFKPAGAARKRTTWAVKLKKPGRYLAVDSSGDAERDGGTKDGKYVVKIEAIIASPTEVTEKSAGYSFTYGEMMLLPEPVRGGC